MTVFENYSAKGELTTKVDEPVTIQNLERFATTYDPKVVQGYMMALADFTKEIEKIVWDKEDGDIGYYPRTAARVRTLTEKFHNEKDFLLKHFQSRGTSLPTPPDQPRPMQD